MKEEGELGMETPKWNQKQIEHVVCALKQHPLKKKTDIFNVFTSLKIEKSEHEPLLNELREKHLLTYSRRKPVGYIINDRELSESKDRSGSCGENPQSEKIDERQMLLQKKVPDRLKKSEEQVNQILKEREQVRESIKQQNWAKCPRCGGRMNVRTIRCGPGRMIQISVCSTCNFNIPLLETLQQ